MAQHLCNVPAAVIKDGEAKQHSWVCKVDSRNCQDMYNLICPTHFPKQLIYQRRENHVYILDRPGISSLCSICHMEESAHKPGLKEQ